jgi:hypothetical protein
MASQTEKHRCVACGCSDDEAPLLALEYRGSRLWICPPHLPVLIHDPAQLAGKLAGAETFRAAEHHD